MPRSKAKPYVIVQIRPLNGGSGSVRKKFSKHDFEFWYAGMFPTFPIPTPPTVGSIGNCFFNFQFNFPEGGDPLADQQVVPYQRY